MMAHYWKEENKQEPEDGERDEKGRFKPSDTRVSDGAGTEKGYSPSELAAAEFSNWSG